VGLRNLSAATATSDKDKRSRAAMPAFKQYREADGQFYFKLVDARGRLLLQSAAFASAKEAGQAIARLREGPATAGYVQLGQMPPDVQTDEIDAALRALAEAI
jgi:tryptophanyl-tRNA synthetase